VVPLSRQRRYVRGEILKYTIYQPLRRIRLEEWWSWVCNTMPNTTTAIIRHGILLKYIHYQSCRMIRLEERVELGNNTIPNTTVAIICHGITEQLIQRH
jgi:hypothetical protein